jgi:dTDP-4-amino-4,6-dideoxygalactose transaminase
MTIEKISDVVHWAREYHQLLAECMQHCSEHALLEKGQMLLHYLSEHEQRLTETLKRFEHATDADSLKALHTWCYDYLKQHPVKSHPDCDGAYAELSTQEIMQQVEHEHAQIIALYKHLRGHVETPTAQDFIDQLISLEEHEGMRMSQSANRLDDL